MNILAPLFIILITLLISFQALAVPPGFVYLKDVDSTIVENMRYFTGENFVGRKVEGYESNRAILTAQAAKALSRVQQDLLKEGYSLVVYDAYRPQRAVNYFIKWSKDPDDQVAKEKYYPNINKADLFKEKYIAEKSGHSRGSTVDVSIIKSGLVLKNLNLQKTQLSNGNVIPFLDDGTVNMGSSFDLFDEPSHHDNNLISSEHLKIRNHLRDIMIKHGFKDYHEEWWHYTLENEPYPNTYFDFVVK